MRRFRSTLPAVLVILASAACSDSSAENRAPAAATSAASTADRIVQIGCRQGQCTWLKVARVETVQTLSQGELRRIVGRRGTSVHRDGKLPSSPSKAGIEWEAEEGEEYAFCSAQRPAYAFESDSQGVLIHFLDLFALGGYQYASARLYMRFCHGLEELPDEPALAALGYRAGTRSEQVEATGVEGMTRF